MPKKAQDLRLHGISFEEALKRLVSAPPVKRKGGKRARKKSYPKN